MSRVDPSRLQLAIVHHRAGRLADAVKVSSEIVAAQPNNFDATYLLAVFHAEQGAIASAVEMFSRAVRLRPNSFDAHYNLAVAMNLAEEHEGALKHYKRALRLNPNHSDAINNYAVTLSKLRRFQDAVQQYRQLVHITPDHAEGHYYLSVVLTELEQFEDAIESAEKAIAIFPGYAEAYFSRGVALAESNRPEEALSSYEKAIALKPDYTDAYRNRDMLLLLLGDFDRGWSRWSGSQRQPSVGIRQFDKPLWLGDTDIAGKTLLVHWEQQGLGDTIQFCRFVPLLQDMRIRVLFMPQPALRALMSSLSNKIEIVGDDDGVLPDFDYHCPLMSLPFALKTTIESIPRRIPYLYAEADRVRKLWGGGDARSDFKIGIAWQGNVAARQRGKSVSLSQFERLSKLLNTRLISLQKKDDSEQVRHRPAGMRVETLGNAFDAGPDAFLDTAAVMKNLDLVITIDTAIAHLAGALGVPTWVALKQVPDWRWLMNRSDSPWYPTMRLFRQKVRGDWDGVFADIEAALIEEVAARRDSAERAK